MRYTGLCDDNMTITFKDGANKTVEYTWDANGNMTSDLNKGKYIGTIPSMKELKNQIIKTIYK